MGKYMKKPKTTGDVTVVMEVSSSPCSSAIGVRTRAKTLALQKSDSYLQLRSRRLQKLLVAPPPPTKKSDACTATPCVAADHNGEPFSGENTVELDTRDRSARESTPCSLIRDSIAVDTPGSTTRQRTSTSNQRVHGLIQRNIPTAYEMDEFFAYAEKQQQTIFMDKYNYDVVNDIPLPGRYEWVQVHH